MDNGDEKMNDNDSMHGWRFDEPLNGWIQHVGTTKGNDTPKMFREFKEYLMERCKRLELINLANDHAIKELHKEIEEARNIATDFRDSFVNIIANLLPKELIVRTQKLLPWEK